MANEDQVISYTATTTLAEICLSINKLSQISPTITISATHEILTNCTQEIYNFLLSTLLNPKQQLTTNQSYNILKLFVMVMKRARKDTDIDDENDNDDNEKSLNKVILNSTTTTTSSSSSSDSVQEAFKIIRLLQLKIPNLFDLFCQQKVTHQPLVQSNSITNSKKQQIMKKVNNHFSNDE
jgi:L-asparaginase/Glu-tRNA(Gln) amidotransferase subunit D